MESYSFIDLFITNFFTNTGLQDYFTFTIGAFGVAICVKVATIAIPRIFEKWH